MLDALPDFNYTFINSECAICGSSNYDYLGKRYLHRDVEGKTKSADLEVSIVKCRDCGLIYPKPIPVPDEISLQKQYSGRDAYFSDELDLYKIRYYREVLKRLGDLSKAPGKKLLDIGCGEGDFLSMAADEGYESLGVDISEEFVRHARSRGLEVIQGEFTEMAFPPEKHFNIIVMYALLEHVFRPKEYLIKAKEVLADDGILYVKVPNEGSIIFSVGDLYKRISMSQETTHLSVFSTPYHIYGFTQHTLRRLFDMLGLRILRMRVFNDGPSGFMRSRTLYERIEKAGYAMAHNLCGLINQGISIEAYVKKA